MDLLSDVGQIDAPFGPSEIVLINMQEMCTVCAKRAVDSEIILHSRWNS
jgi:hypothetical protein